MEVFKSKRFWTALLGIISMILVGVVPELEAHLDTLIPGILGIVGLLIGGYSLEDAVQPKPGRGSNAIPFQVRAITTDINGDVTSTFDSVTPKG